MYHTEMPALRNALAGLVQAAELGYPALLLRDNPMESEKRGWGRFWASPQVLTCAELRTYWLTMKQHPLKETSSPGGKQKTWLPSLMQ